MKKCQYCGSTRAVLELQANGCKYTLCDKCFNEKKYKNGKK